VILSRTTVNVRPPARIFSTLVAASRSITNFASMAIEKPCAIRMSSVHPSGQRPMSRSVQRLAPLHPRQALPRRLLLPVRPRIGVPHRVHTMRGPNIGTGTSSGHGSALMIAR
jgi:hypothetical protein